MHASPADSTVSCDVAVVGGGMAGMIAGLRAAQGGKQVCVLEKSADERYVCNSRLTAGVWHCCQMDVGSDPAKLEEAISRVTGGHARADLARAVAHDGIRVVRWMQSVGIRFIKGMFDYQSFVLSPPTVTPQGRQWEGRGGDVMLRTFETELRKAGGQLLRGHRGTRLLLDGERVCGLAGERNDGGKFKVAASAVILADGGFQANPELIRGVITPAPEKVFQRNARTGTGDGMRMAQEVGAATSGLGGFYGHVLSKDAFTSEKLWPYAWLDFVLSAGIVVRRDGRRFSDEGLGGVNMANAIAALDDPSTALVIADERIWNERGTFNVVPPNPHLLNGGGTVYKASTLRQLAGEAGLDEEAFVACVGEYNEAVRGDSVHTLVPPRTTTRFKAFGIEKGPFFAFPACAGITYTMGGLTIDADCRVIGTDGRVIRGLYAAGCTTGGLEGGERAGYVGGLVKSSVTGLRAAEHILKRDESELA